LYFPYARCTDSNLLKRAILIFDELNFVDPLERRIRETIELADVQLGGFARAWNLVADDYAFLEREGFLRRIDPSTAISDFDGLLAQALLCDVRDEEFMRVAAQLAAGDYWGILHGKIPPESLLADAMAFTRTRFWRDPATVDFRRVGPDGRPRTGRSPFQMAIAHDYIPLACGYAINVNIGLLLAEMLDVIPISDDPIAIQLLRLKYMRAQGFLGGHPRAVRSAQYLYKYQTLGFRVIAELLPGDYMQTRTVEDLLRFRQSETDSFVRFREVMFEFTSMIEEDPWTPAFEDAVTRIVDGKVIPEARRAREQLTVAYDKMFGSIAQKTVTAATPSVVASVFAGLSAGQILTLSSAAVAGALTIALPDLLELWKDRRAVKRNGLSFLLR
jgi:hypothetical protein